MSLWTPSQLLLVLLSYSDLLNTFVIIYAELEDTATDAETVRRISALVFFHLGDLQDTITDLS